MTVLTPPPIKGGGRGGGEEWGGGGEGTVYTLDPILAGGGE